MKNLKSLKEALAEKNLNYRQLSKEEKKMVKGGYYTTEEECKNDCGSGPYDPRWSYKHYCMLGADGYWTCYDS